MSFKRIGFLSIILLISVSILYISGCSNTPSNEEASNYDGDETKIPSGDLPVLLEFYADYCPPCQQMKPIISELQREYNGKIDIKTIDVQTEQELASHYKIEYLPTQVYLDKNGKEVFRHVGFASKEDIISHFRVNKFE
ncbi:MAG: thioredoxin family protein [Armatimonadota bacterium]